MSDHQMKTGLIAGTSKRVMPWTISSQCAHVAERSGARPVQRLGGDERIICPRVPSRSRSGRYSLNYDRQDIEAWIKSHAITQLATPFISMCGRSKAEAAYHEWLTDTLDTAGNNIQIEGWHTSPVYQ